MASSALSQVSEKLHADMSTKMDSMIARMMQCTDSIKVDVKQVTSSVESLQVTVAKQQEAQEKLQVS